MATCKYCKQPAGFLRTKHKECHQKFLFGKKHIKEAIIETVTQGQPMENLDIILKEEERKSFLSTNIINDLLISGFESVVDKAFDDGILTNEEEQNLKNYIQHYSLSQSMLDKNRKFTQIVQGGVLRELMEGKIPQRFKIPDTLPFNFQKSEKLIWLFQQVEYFEHKRKIEYVGGSRGVSVRIAKGVYYRTSSFKGKRIERTELQYVDNGLLGVTNKHLYFTGGNKTFRIKHDKIISIQPSEDGVTIQKDGATAKPQVFITNDGWFTQNLLSNVSQL